MWPFWERYGTVFGAVCFTIQCGSNFLSVTQTMQCDHSLKSYWKVLHVQWYCLFYYTVCGSNFLSVGETMQWLISRKLLNNTVLWYCLFYYTVWFYFFHLCIKPCSVPIRCKATEAVLYCGTVCFTVQCGSNLLCVNQTMQCYHSL